MKKYLVGFGILLLMLAPISLALILGPWSLLIDAAAGWLIFRRPKARRARR